MIYIHLFTFNPFQENMYLVWDETKECVIIDPGCYDIHEREMLDTFIKKNELKPIMVANTHCHIDHIFGISHCVSKYNIPFVFHELDMPVLNADDQSASTYGVEYDKAPQPNSFIKEGEQLTFGKSTMEIRFTPGHSPGSVCFIDVEGKNIIGGDVLFQGSVGRFDLPGGDQKVLFESIREELYTLPDDFTVYSGHGPETTIGFEKKNNPFVRGDGY